jgi:hypothetical protein
VGVPADPIALLRRHPDVRAGVPHPTDLAGHPATVMDLTFAFRRPLHAAPQCRYRSVRCTSLGPDDYHVAGERMRLYVLRAGGRTLLVAVGGYDAKGFRTTLAHARSVLDSLAIDG